MSVCTSRKLSNHPACRQRRNGMYTRLRRSKETDVRVFKDSGRPCKPTHSKNRVSAHTLARYDHALEEDPKKPRMNDYTTLSNKFLRTVAS